MTDGNLVPYTYTYSQFCSDFSYSVLKAESWTYDAQLRTPCSAFNAPGLNGLYMI